MLTDLEAKDKGKDNRFIVQKLMTGAVSQVRSYFPAFSIGKEVSTTPVETKHNNNQPVGARPEQRSRYSGFGNDEYRKKQGWWDWFWRGKEGGGRYPSTVDRSNSLNLQKASLDCEPYRLPRPLMNEDAHYDWDRDEGGWREENERPNCLRRVFSCGSVRPYDP